MISLLLAIAMLLVFAIIRQILIIETALTVSKKDKEQVKAWSEDIRDYQFIKGLF